MFIDILQGGEAGEFGKLKSSTKTCQYRQPHPRLQAVQQLAVLDDCKTDSDCYCDVTTSKTAVMTSYPLAATISALNSDTVENMKCRNSIRNDFFFALFIKMRNGLGFDS